MIIISLPEESRAEPTASSYADRREYLTRLSNFAEEEFVTLIRGETEYRMSKTEHTDVRREVEGWFIRFHCEYCTRTEGGDDNHYAPPASRRSGEGDACVFGVRRIGSLGNTWVRVFELSTEGHLREGSGTGRDNLHFWLEANAESWVLGARNCRRACVPDHQEASAQHLGEEKNVTATQPAIDGETVLAGYEFHEET